ncbi:MAG TPA: NAD-binding protein [Coriobacteriia bacterium]|jgi:trk system potassium uptake protein TrkA
MVVVIVGGGKVGSFLAQMLGEAGHEVTLVEFRPEQCTRLEGELQDNVRLICGDGDEPYILEDANVTKADAIVAATGDDEDNLVVCLLGKYEYKVPLTIARINNPKNEWLFTDEFGVDIPVSNTSMIANLLEKHVVTKQ